MPENDDSEQKWWIYVVYASTLVPWAFMQLFDAIDENKRHVAGLPWRLGSSLVCNFVSTAVGLWYVVWADGRSRTEAATILIGVALNTHYWKRNLRGWRSYCVLMCQRTNACEFLACLMNMRMQGMPRHRRSFDSGRLGNGAHVTAENWNKMWDYLWVNDKVIDNDRRKDNVSLASGSWHSKIGGDVLWRMVWLQGTVGKPLKDGGNSPENEKKKAAQYAAGEPPCHGEKEIIRKEALEHLLRVELGDDETEVVSVQRLETYKFTLSKLDQSRLEEQADENSRGILEGWKPTTREERIESLINYDVGQQDIGGLPPASVNPPASTEALCCAMSWVTGGAPPPVENIWYESAAVADILEKFATDEDVGHASRASHASHAQWPTFPRLSRWYRIAGDLARLRDVPLLLSIREGKRYALRLASVSALLAYQEANFKALCVKVHQLGIKARWTHGWSGLVSCYSMWWTLGNVSIALLGGLPLLAIDRGLCDNDSVACLLVGLALSDGRRAARTSELARRYYLDKGRTCRGSGVGCIRQAMEDLGLPRSASQLDGVIAFSVGWAMEAVHGLPGNQKPRDGQNHGQIEDQYSSSRAYRFPDERL